MPLSPKLAAAVAAAVLAYIEAERADGRRKDPWKMAGRSWSAGRYWKLAGRFSLLGMAHFWSMRPGR